MTVTSDVIETAAISKYKTCFFPGWAGVASGTVTEDPVKRKATIPKKIARLMEKIACVACSAGTHWNCN